MQLHPSPPFPSQTLCHGVRGHLLIQELQQQRQTALNADTLKRSTYLWGLSARGQRLTTSDWVYFSFPIPLDFSVVKSKHFAGFFCWLFIFYYFRKKAGSGTALSHHFKFLIFLLAFDFVLIDCFSSETKFGPSFSPPNLHLSASVNRKGWGLRSARSWYTNFHAQKCTAAPELITFPSSCGRPGKNLLSLLFLICLQLLKKIIPIKVLDRKTITPSKRAEFKHIFWCVESSLILLFDCILTPILCWAGWSDPQLCSPGFGTVTQQKCTGLGFLLSLLSDPEHTL